MRSAQTTATDRTKVTLPRGSSILLPCILTVYMLDLTIYEFTCHFYGFFSNLVHAQTVFHQAFWPVSRLLIVLQKNTVINIRLFIIPGVLKNTPHLALSDI